LQRSGLVDRCKKRPLRRDRSRLLNPVPPGRAHLTGFSGALHARNFVSSHYSDDTILTGPKRPAGGAGGVGRPAPFTAVRGRGAEPGFAGAGAGPLPTGAALTSISITFCPRLSACVRSQRYGCQPRA
jgi:hypothetical protein